MCVYVVMISMNGSVLGAALTGRLRIIMSKVGILAIFWSFWGPKDYILFQENILPVFRSLLNPKSLALRALDFVHSSTPNH